MTLTIEQGFSTLIRGKAQEVTLDSEQLLEDWTFVSGLGTPRCGHVTSDASWCRTPIELDLVQPVILDHFNGRTTLLDGADSGLPTLRDELESWFLQQLSGDERIKETTCGTVDGWNLADFRSAVAGARHVVFPVGAYRTIMSTVLDHERGTGRTQFQARAGLSAGLACMESSYGQANLSIGSSFVLRRREDRAIVADVPRQLRLMNHVEPYYTRINFPWLTDKEDTE